MSAANPSSNSSYQTAWDKALEHLDNLPAAQQKYFDLLEPNERAIFRTTVSAAEVLEVLHKLGESKPSIKRIIKFSENFAKPFSRFQNAIETVAITCSGLGGPIWAPIKLFMSAADEFEKIASFLEDTLEKLIRFDKYEKHFQSSPREALELVHDALTRFYVDVIDLTLVTTKHYRSSTIRYFARRALKTFDSDFGEIMSNMKRHVEAIDPVANLGGIIEAKHNHQDVSTQLGRLKIEADQTAVARSGRATKHNLKRIDQADKIRFAWVDSEERKSAASKWLYCTSAKSHQELNHSKHLDTTCNWFFQRSEFGVWRKSKDSSRLCAQGIPGCGKSVLSSVIINRLSNEVPQGEPVVYFFCKENDANRDNPLSILRTLVSQLLGHPAHGVAFVNMVHDALLSSGTPSADSITDLWALLEKIAAMLPTVYCVIDALDECSNTDGQLVNFLNRLTALSTSNTTVFKIFATCRLNEPYIDNGLGKTWSLFVIKNSNVQDDIDAFISERIKESSTLSLDAHRDKIHSSVLQGAGGMILWAKLMLDELCDAEPWDIEEVLADMPDGLSAMYKLMLQRRMSLGKRPLEKCRKVLHWTATACRPLTVDELLLALAVSAGVTSHDDSRLDRASALQNLRQVCGSLVTILEDGSVQLVHTSLRQYLIKGIDVSASQDPVSLAFATNMDRVHMDLARICLRYSQFACFREDITTLSLDDVKAKYPFLEYSTRNWIYHVIRSGSSCTNLSTEITKFFNSTQGWRWLQRCGRFGISQGHIFLLRAELKAWVGAESLTIQDDIDETGDFILYLSRKRYEETTQEIGGDNLETMEAAFKIADAYRGRGKYEEALEWYERALAGKEKALGKEHPSTLDTVNNMALVYDSQGRYEEALEWYERALAGSEKALGKEHPSTLNTVNNMASVYNRQGRYEEALEWYERALAGSGKALGKEHPSTLDTVNNMALVYNSQGRYEEALEWYERALAGYEKALGKEHPSTLNTVNNMTIVYNNQGRYEEALEWYGRALAGYEKALGKEHPSTLNTVNNMAIVYDSQGRYEEALEWYGRALAGYEKALGKEHPSTLNTVNNMAIVYNNQGWYEKALEWYGRALAGYEKALGKEHPSTLDTVNNMAIVYKNQGVRGGAGVI